MHCVGVSLRGHPTFRLVFLVLLFAAGASSPAHADGFINPFVGFHFGSDSACPNVANCEEKDVEIGISVGALNAVFGFELDFGSGKNFLGRAPNFESASPRRWATCSWRRRLGSFGRTASSASRAFRTLQDVTAFGFDLPDTRILFGRADIGVVFKF